jgi:hypothetical protein
MGNNVFAPPASGSEAVSPSSRQFEARFFWAFAAWALLLAVTIGSVLTLQVADGLTKFGGLEYLARVTSLSIVRDLAPGAAATATFLALIVWSHPLDAATLRARLRSTIGRALLTALASLPLVTSVAVGTAMLTARVFHGVSWGASLSATVQTIHPADLSAALEVLGVYAGGVGLLAYFSLAPFNRMGWSLSLKIVAAWVALFAVRPVLVGILSVLLAAPS